MLDHKMSVASFCNTTLAISLCIACIASVPGPGLQDLFVPWFVPLQELCAAQLLLLSNAFEDQASAIELCWSAVKAAPSTSCLAGVLLLRFALGPRSSARQHTHILLITALAQAVGSDCPADWPSAGYGFLSYVYVFAGFLQGLLPKA